VELGDVVVHRSAGSPGVDAGKCLVKNVRFLFGSARTSAIPTLPIELADGTLTAGGTSYSNTVPLPFSAKGPCRLLLSCIDGVQVEIAGSGVSIEGVGSSRYLDEFPGIR
jgi:hypothetical protein